MSIPHAQLQSLSPDAVVELFELNMTPKDLASNNKYYFHNGTNKLSANVVWKAKEYLAWPIEVSGFEKHAGGSLPRIQVRMSNQGGYLSLLYRNFSGLVGAKLTRRRTFVRYLDAVNFASGVNPTADNTVELPDDIFFFDHVVGRNRLSVELEFASEYDVEGIMLPRRQVTNGCRWCYRGAECEYVGKPVADDFGVLLPVTPLDTAAPFAVWSSATAYVVGDVVTYADTRRVFTAVLAGTNHLPTNTTYWFEDKCGGRLSDCKLRVRTNDVYPFGGFPGATRVPSHL